jgi:type IV pilus assembly protein PilX
MTLRLHSAGVRQTGAALITGLITLLVLTIIGVAGMQAASMEERMAANARRRDLAFQAAESGLRDGESWLFSQAGQPSHSSFSCAGSNGLYLGNCGNTTPLWESLESSQGWTGSAARQVSGWPPAAGIAPSYIIEEIQRGGTLNSNLDLPRANPDAVVYRITARGAGPGQTPDAFAVVQSTFKKSD